MQRFDPVIGVVAVVLSAVTVPACSTPPAIPVEVATTRPVTPVAAPLPPPPGRAEIPPSAPSPRALWTFGHWNWNGARYVWAPGHYVERPTPTANWRPGYWEQHPEGWMWVDGQWTS